VVSLVSSFLGSRRLAVAAGTPANPRLRVNPRTFELETTEG